MSVPCVIIMYRFGFPLNCSMITRKLFIHLRIHKLMEAFVTLQKFLQDILELENFIILKYLF